MLIRAGTFIRMRAFRQKKFNFLALLVLKIWILSVTTEKYFLNLTEAKLK